MPQGGLDHMAEHPPVVSYYGFGSGGSAVDVEHPLVRGLDAWHQRLTGAPLAYVSGTGINDMRYFNLAGVPCGCYGAKGANAHGANEWLDLASLAPTMKVIAAAVLDWCGGADHEENLR